MNSATAANTTANASSGSSLLGQGAGLNLAADAVARVLAHQQRTGLRFGEAAVALGLAGPAEVEQALARQFGYPVSGAGGSTPDLVVARQPYSPEAEAFRGLRAQLRLRLAQAQPNDATAAEPGALRPRALAVLSPARGDGRSHVAANLAVVFAQAFTQGSPGRTLLIDADLRRPRLHTVFGLGSGTVGLAQMLSGRSAQLAVDAVPGLPALFVLGAGAVPPNPLELLEGPAWPRLLADVADKFDQVIVDTPAFGSGMDAAVVAAACGAGLMVLRPGHSALAAAQDLMACLPTQTTGPAPVFQWAGAVFNQRR